MVLVAVLINDQHRPEDGGKPWKHLDGDCPLLLRRAAAGFSIRRVPNSDHGKPAESHIRRACLVCFQPGEPLGGIQPPAWLAEARRLEQGSDAVAWVYNLQHPYRKVAQVGMATNLHSRLKSRFTATLAGRFDKADNIPWYYDLLAAKSEDEPVLNATPFPSRAAAREAERDLRDKLRAEGWSVTSDV
jgi:hypothetical protein